MAKKVKLGTGREELVFHDHEIDNSFITLNREEAATLVNRANDSIDNWSDKGFLKIRLSDADVPQQENSDVDKLLKMRNGDELNGATISVAIQSIKKYKEGVYRASISADKRNLTIAEYVNLVDKELFPGRFENGIDFYSQLFGRLRQLKEGESIEVYYPGLTSRVALTGEESSGFNIEDIKTPLQEVIPKNIPGICSGCYTYFGITGSCFFCHVDDFGLNACNLVTFGTSKIWIIIPKEYKEKLQKLLCSLHPKNLKCFANHKDLLVDPSFLRANSIPFRLVDQSNGEIMLVASNTWHFGVNFSEAGGITVAVAINLLLDDYLFKYGTFKIDKPCRCTKVSVFLTKKEEAEMSDRIKRLQEVTGRKPKREADDKMTKPN